MIPEDIVALRRLSDVYADAVDRRDAAALLDVFSADARLVVQPDGGPVQDEWSGEGISGLLQPLERYERTFHQVGGCVFEDDGDAAGGVGATGRVHLVAHHYERTANGPVDLVMFIVYHDLYTKRLDGWRIGERRVAVQWTQMHPAHPIRRARS